MKLRSLCVYLIFVGHCAIKCNSQLLPSISCTYSSWFPEQYECLLNIFNPTGFDGFQMIQGEHLPGFGNDNVTEILFANGNTVNVPEVICRQFPNLRLLDLRFLEIRFTSQISLSWCLSIESLNFDSNQIIIVDQNTFINSIRLRSLDLTFNRINILPEDLFDNLSNLEQLELNFNTLHPIHSNQFSKLVNLKKLGLDSVGMTFLDQNLLRGLSNLQELYLQYNRITFLSENCFSHLTNLTTLNLSGNPLNGSIPSGLFRNLWRLNSLALDNIGITAVNPQWFETTTNLKNLQLRSNLIHQLPGNIFRNLTNLYSLSLSSNNLTENSIHAETFDNMTQLSFLDLNFNYIKELNPRWFHNLQLLTSIWLTFNEIEELPVGIFSRNNFLNSVSVGYNKLTSINRNSFGNLTNLVTFYAQGNKILAIDGKFFDHSNRLRDLSLLANECINENFQLFFINREQNLERLRRCTDSFRFIVDIQTHFNNSYTFFDALPPGLHLQIKSPQSAYIALSANQTSNTEILIGIENNTRTAIRMHGSRIVVNASTPSILNPLEYRNFRITWVNQVILVFRGNDEFPFIAHSMEDMNEINFYGLKSPKNDASWRVRPLRIQ